VGNSPACHQFRFSFVRLRRLVYRDIKQENIGFDIRGDVKVFDFGLSKGLSSSLKAKQRKTGDVVYGYNLTPQTGSIPYMAPEVASGLPYDGQCDVFSFAILLWEIFTLRPAFKLMTRLEYMTRVVEQGERLPFPWRGGAAIPSLIKALIKEAWNSKPTQRPTMQRVAHMIRGELNIVCDGNDAFIRRTTHMNNRSSHSVRLGPTSELWNSPSALHDSYNKNGDHHGPLLSKQLHYNGPSLHNGIQS
jgi:serine/threonine protein kinase